ncbi:hypothetical protein GRI69_12990 [Erythrobacter vulgaris]|uniref:Uncharacterized protein n=1 Tax=Qipengyuania vulgaris TaxID=291985 RepID=A0A844XST8_9SPHN|nr:hypothetical protein [Qipengyuania vulgaris]MXO49175.1 hypothetical protein [Qipengyuania vulgaris]
MQFQAANRATAAVGCMDDDLLNQCADSLSRWSSILASEMVFEFGNRSAVNRLVIGRQTYHGARWHGREFVLPELFRSLEFLKSVVKSLWSFIVLFDARDDFGDLTPEFPQFSIELGLPALSSTMLGRQPAL